MELPSIKRQVNKLPWWLRAVLLTLYIAFVNSYALFVIYPSLKTDGIGPHLLEFIVYIALAFPLAGLIFESVKSRVNRRYMLLGLGVFIVAMVILAFLHPQSPEMFVFHFALYLIIGFVEETLWRGKLWGYIKDRNFTKKQTATIVTAHFVILHIPFAILGTMNPLFFLGQVLALGIVLAVLRIVTKHTVAPAFVHAIVNVIVYT